jgi:hypothetical protein
VLWTERWLCPCQLAFIPWHALWRASERRSLHLA